MMIFVFLYFLVVGFRTHVVATTVCVRREVYTLTCCARTCSLHIARAHLVCAHPHIFMRVQTHAWLKVVKKVFAVCISHISISPSPLSCFTRRPCCSRTVTSTLRSRPHRLAELYPTQKRGSSAFPHERRGVWLLGRSRALHSPRELAENPILTDQSMHVLWKPTNLRESGWKELSVKIMKITSQKGTKFFESLQSCAQVHSYASSNEDSGSDSRGGPINGTGSRKWLHGN